MKKICTKCRVQKDLSEFNKSKINKDGFRRDCKSCQKIYREINKEKLKQQRKQYYEFHKVQINEYDKKYKNEKRKNDIEYKIKTNLRTRLTKALKENWKSGKTLELLACSIKEFKKHLQNQFKPGMSWDNYGLWHIDHKLPCAKFDLSKFKNQRKCFHFSNLQPLWAKDNLRKGSK